MEEVGRVMRTEVLFHVRQQSWGLIARYWHYSTVEPRKGLLHACLPGVMLARLGRLFQYNIVTHRLHTHQAQTARKGFILHKRDVFGGHSLREPRTLLTAVRHHGFFHTTVHLLLGPIRRPHKAIEPRQRQEQTHQANAAGANLDIEHMQRDNPAMQEGEPGDTLKK